MDVPKCSYCKGTEELTLLPDALVEWILQNRKRMTRSLHRLQESRVLCLPCREIDEANNPLPELDPSELMCRHCLRTFRSETRLLTHEASCVVPFGVQWEFRCPYCPYNCHLGSKMVKHRRLVHYEAEPCVYKCGFCYGVFRTAVGLNKHKKTHN